MSLDSTAVRRLNDYVSALIYHWRKKQNKTKQRESYVKGAD